MHLSVVKKDPKDTHSKEAKRFPPLELEGRPAVPTAQAAYYLNRRPQTLRCWSCNEDGPIQPITIMGRLAWPTSEIRRLLGVGTIDARTKPFKNEPGV